MTLHRPREIEQLVARLASRSGPKVEAAQARLTILGGRAVESLVEALEGGEARVQKRALEVLCFIGDQRARRPVIALLLDRNLAIRTAAAEALASFPDPESARALERLLKREEDPGVREAAVGSLVRLYQAGLEEALGGVMGVLLDRDEATGCRETAVEVLRQLRARERRALLRRLTADPDPGVASRAQELKEGPPETSGTSRRLLRADLDRLGAEDLEEWTGAWRRLCSRGGAVVEPLVDAMLQRALDPHFCHRAGMVLRALPPRSLGVLAGSLQSVSDPLPLEILVEVAGASGVKSLIYRLKDLIDRLAREETASRDGAALARVKAKAHLQLARVGSRVAVADLKTTLSSPDRRVDMELLGALELVGRRDDLIDLLRAHRKEDPWMRERIRDVFRTVMRRERVRRNHRMFRGLPPAEARALVEVLPPKARRTR